MTQLKSLHNEFTQLKSELFAGLMFVIESPEDKPKWDRYNQLLALFYPCYRTTTWINPAI